MFTVRIWIVFYFDPVGYLLLIIGRLLKIYNMLFRLKYFAKQIVLPYHNAFWALNIIPKMHEKFVHGRV